MASHPAVTALRRSHDNLQALVAPLTPDQVRDRSYASEWSIAQVLSHLGSGAVIGSLNLDALLADRPAPGREQYEAVWDEWNAKTPDAQAADVLPADERLVAGYEALDDDRLAALRTTLGPMELDGPGMVRMRLSEHALHTWDVAVALDPAAVVEPLAVTQIVDNLAMIVGFAAKPLDAAERIVVATTAPERRFVLDSAERVTLAPATDDDGPAGVTLPAEALVRLVYGRLEPTGDQAIDRLLGMFPGF
ncbi:maleylpyruvate isomerase family mycothiol-dependent enzyme [Pseudonocardia sp. GCM10023141]|uniref:maleylpyruvate isomerase family mycothiol-dependent enzyme n=1 Tax=Pseudonocardia sp. GCM10023141 TaxID=3252653 RepID=UPI0036161811